MRNRRAFVAVLGLGLAVGCAPTATPASTTPDAAPPALAPGSPTDTLVSIEAEIEQGLPGAEAAQCRAWSEQLVSLHEDHGAPYVNARLLAGATLHRCGLPQDAEQVLQVALDPMPRWAKAEALNTLAVVAHERGDFGNAVALLFEALRFDPVLLQAQDNLIRIMTRRYVQTDSEMAYEEAMRRASEWIERAPDAVVPQLHRARLLALRGRTSPESLGEAEVLLSDLVRRRLSPSQTAKAYTIWAEIYAGNGDDTKALRYARRATELDPQHAPALLLSGYSMLRMRDFDGARQVLEQAEGRVDPFEEHERLRALAVAYRGLRSYKQANQVYEQMAQRWPDDVVDRFNRSHFELLWANDFDPEAGFDGKGYKRALAGFERVIELTADDPRYRELHDGAVQERDRLEELFKPTVHRALHPEQQRLMELERKQQKAERKRLLEIEERAKKAWDSQQESHGGAPGRAEGRSP